MAALRTLLIGAVLLVWWGAAVGSRASAQTLEEQLRQHVDDGLQRSRARNRERSDSKKKPPESTDANAAPPEPAPPEPSAPPPPSPDDALPLRVFGKYAEFDLTLGFGYRGWVPQQYRAADVRAGSYWTYSVELRAKLFRFLNLRRGYYESNDIIGPQTKDAVVAAKIGSYAPKAVWLLGALGVPIGRTFEPQVRYEARSFETRANAQNDVCIVDRNAASDATGCPGTRGRLAIVTSVETIVAGVRYDASKQNEATVGAAPNKTPPLLIGIGLMQYRKPYQLTLDSSTLDKYLFDARFRGAGLALGAEFPAGVNHFFGDIDGQLGLGEVSLTKALSLNELVPDGDLIGYGYANATLGYRLALTRGPPTLIFAPVIRAGGALFFLVDTHAKEGQAAASANFNWDFLWSVQATLLLPL